MPVLVVAFVVIGAIAACWLLLTVQPTTLARSIRGITLGAIGLVALLLGLRGLAVLDLPLGGLVVYLLHHWSARGFPGVARVKAWVNGRAHHARDSTVKTGGGRMSREEALQVLGLPPDADQMQIKAAHRRLMTKLHPDQGGSDYLASQINAARDVLL